MSFRRVVQVCIASWFTVVHTARCYCTCSGLLTQVHPKPGQTERAENLTAGEAQLSPCGVMTFSAHCMRGTGFLPQQAEDEYAYSCRAAIAQACECSADSSLHVTARYRRDGQHPPAHRHKPVNREILTSPVCGTCYSVSAITSVFLAAYEYLLLS